MHSASTRFNAVTMYGFFVMAILCILNFTHGYILFTPKVHVDFSVESLVNFIDTSLWDQSSFKYNLHANLAPLHTWNLKQLYVYLEFEWSDPTSKLNSRTIASDWILQEPQDLSQLNQKWTINANSTRIEYLVRDVYHGLRGNTVKISLNVEYMPKAGLFFNARVFETTYKMPGEYTNAGVK